MSFEIVIPIVLLFCGISVFIGWYLNSRSGQNRISSAREQARKVVADGEKEAETLKREKLLEVKDEWYQEEEGI